MENTAKKKKKAVNENGFWGEKSVCFCAVSFSVFKTLKHKTFHTFDKMVQLLG